MIDEDAIMEDADLLYQAGYHALSIEECPYPEAAKGPYVLWMQGWHEHQRHRHMVEAAAAKEACVDPLNFGWL